MLEVNSKDELQALGVERFMNLSPRKGTAVIGTGLGKSALAIKIAKEIKPKEILLLINSTRLRDVDWKEEFEKFGLDWNIVIAECYQTAYKWEGRKFEFVIADELDFALAPELSKFFLNNEIETLIGLTAFVPEEKQELLNTIAPMYISFSTQEGQKANILNQSKVYEVRFKLSEKKTIKIEYKDKKTGQMKHFFQSENGMYEYLEKNYNKALVETAKANQARNNAVLLNGDVKEEEKKIARAEAKLKMFSRKRKELLHRLESSRNITRMLSDQILKKEDSKILIFSELSDQIDKICEHTFHMKSTDSYVVDKLNSGEIRELGVLKKLNRGANLVGVNHLIKESYVGSETDFLQQFGRGVRLGIEETMYFYILVPYYKTTVKTERNGIVTTRYEVVPTQANKWYKKMSDSFDSSIIEVMDFTQVSL